MNNNRLNIIKHIEEKENVDIFQDYNEIRFILDGEKYTRKPLYWMIKVPFKEYYLENVFLKNIHNKSQIHNRIQYIKQSGYSFKEYTVADKILTIVFE